MPSGKDFAGGRRGSSTTKKNAFCSFCRKSYRDVGPLVEGLTFDRKRMRDAIDGPMFATDRAVELAAQGMPFRAAYAQVAEEAHLLDQKPPEESIKARVSPGGSGNLSLDVLAERLDALGAGSPVRSK